MSTPLVNGAVVGVRCYSVYGAQTAIQSYYYRCTNASINPATDADIAANIDAIMAAGLIPAMSSQATYKGTTAQWLTPGALRALQISVAGAGPGTGGSAILPSQTSGLVTWRTAFAKPAFRGRTYYPFPPQALSTTTGFPNNTYATIINALAFALLNYTVAGSGGRSSTVEMVLAHRIVPLSYDVITESVFRPEWATTRRRGALGRPNSSPI